MKNILQYAYLPLFVCLLIGAAPYGTAYAAGAFVVDDADVVEKGKVQIESWYAYSRNNEHDVVVNPAYQLLPNAEFSLQLAHANVQGEHEDSIAPEIKYLWLKSDSGLESSVAVGAGYEGGRQRMAQYYAFVPTSLSLMNDKLTINTNIGWQYDDEEDRNYMTWGVGAEAFVDPALSFVAETFGKTDSRQGFQVGASFHLGETLQVDTIYGHNVTEEHGEWYTLGLTLLF